MERFTKYAPYGGFIAALFILLVVNGLAVRSLDAVVKSTQQVIASVEIIDEIEVTLELLTDADSSQYIYLITGEEAALEPYRAAIAPDGLPRRLQQLRELTADNPTQQAQLDLLTSQVAEKLALTEQLIAIRQTQGPEAASQLVRNGPSQRALQAIRDTIEAIDVEQDRILQVNRAAEDARVREAVIGLIAGLVLSIALSVAAVRLFNREIAQRRRAEQTVRQLNTDLEVRVQQRTEELVQANSGLREAEGKYRTLVEQLPAAINIDAVSVTDPTHSHTVYASPYFQTLLGYSAEEIIGDPALWNSLIYPDDRERVVADTLNHYTTGNRLTREYRMQTREGRTIWIDDEALMLPNGSADWKYSQGLIFDITANKQAQAAVIQSGRRFRALIENSTDAISLLGPSGRLEYVSPSTLRILGYTSEEAVGADPATLTHPDDLQIVLPLLADLLQKPGETATAQYRFRHKDGSWRWVESFISNLLADPAVGAIVFNFRDITERKEQERESQAQVSLGAALRTVSTRSEMTPVILDQLTEFLNAQGVALAILVPGTGDLLIELGRGVWATMTGDVIPSGRGVSAQVLASGQPYLNNDAGHDPHLFRPDLFGDCQGMAGVPMVANKEIIGILWLCTTRALSQRDLHLLVAVADLAANAIQRATLHEQAIQQVQRLAALRDIDQAISGSVELRMTLNVILSQTKTQLNSDAVSILLLNKHLMALEFSAGLGFRTQAFANAKPIRMGEGYAGRAALERRPVYIQDLRSQHDNPRLAKTLDVEHFVSYYAIPLIAKGQVKGVIELFQRTPLNPDPDWVGFFEALAGQTAIAIESAQLFDGLQRSNIELSLAYDATIEGWSRAMDLRDKETEGHTQRVTELTLKLATVIGISPDELVHIKRGALLHDIGKMGVPDGILLKPDKLTDEEWVLMRKHPEYAYEMLAPIEYLRRAIDIPYCHHEKWDGTGYPRGLKGLEIPLAARIFAISDVWDALRSDRPYRKGWPPKEVLEHIKSLSGTHFDPEVVEAFLQITQT